MTTTDQALDAANSMITDLKAKLTQVEATAQRRLELLRNCEWSSYSVDGACCPICGTYLRSLKQPHRPDCPLAAELKEGK